MELLYRVVLVFQVLMVKLQQFVIVVRKIFLILGLCLGMQLAVVEYARNVCGMNGAHTTEVDKKTPYPVIDFIPDQVKILQDSRYGATMRLGAYPAVLKKGTIIYSLYEETNVSERHRHRYEVNPQLC